MNTVWEKRRKRLFEIIEIGSNYDAVCWGYDFFNTFTILLNLTVSIMYTFDNMELKYGPLVLMLSSSLCMYSLENRAQPEVFTNAFSGIWWAASTLLTVGYGDIYPVTTIGKIFGIFIAFLGVGMVAIPTGIISAGFVDQYSRRSSRYIRYRMYPSQNSGRAAFPHPALYETHYSTIIRKY